MTSEVREAAGRLRRVQAGEPLSDVYPDWKCETVWPYAADLKLLAYEHLAEHVDDDELPIDEAFWKSLPLDDDGQLYAYDEIWFEWISKGYEDSYLGLILQTYDGVIELPHVKTRGDFRQLCRLFNIPLQPIGQEQSKSRSVLRREAAQRGEEPPDFSRELAPMSHDDIIELVRDHRTPIGPEPTEQQPSGEKQA